MSIQAVAWVLKQVIKPAIAKLAMIAIANYADEHGKCWPSTKRLAEDCSYDKDNLRKALKALQEAGWIRIQERHQDGAQLTNLITINTSRGEGNGTPPGEEGGGCDRPGGEGAGTRRGEGAATLLTINRTIKEPKDSCPIASDVNLEFQSWYQHYPRREARGQALRAYKAARKKVDAQTLEAGAQRARERYASTERQFVPLPATWLNGERWADDWKPEAAQPRFATQDPKLAATYARWEHEIAQDRARWGTRQ